MEKNKENNKEVAVKEAVAVPKEAVAAKPAATEAKKAGYVYLITRPAIEGDWKPTIEIVKDNDPRAVAGPDAVVLPHPAV